MFNKNEGFVKIIVGCIMYVLTFYFKGKVRGWNSLSNIYVLPKAKGKELKFNRGIRLRINDFHYYGRYKTSIDLKIFENGLELQKIIPMQMKNFVIFLNWEDIVSYKQRKILGKTSLIISLKNDYLLFDRKTEVDILIKYLSKNI